jgi:hypothetical protein
MKSSLLAHEELQALVGRALVEPGFCHDLLNGRREACLAEFALTSEERHVAGSIEAANLQEFARQLDGWIRERRLRPAVTPFRAPYTQRLAVAA